MSDTWSVWFNVKEFFWKMIIFALLQPRPNGLSLGRPGSGDIPQVVQDTACAGGPGNRKQKADDGAWGEATDYRRFLMGYVF